MNFQEYIYSISNEARVQVLQSLEKYGDPNLILDELFAIAPCVQNKRLDIRINQNYLLWHTCANFWHPAQTHLIETGKIKYCYHSYASGGDSSTIGIIKTDDSQIEFKVANNQDGIAIANAIRAWTGWFEKIRPYSLEEMDGVVRLPCPIYGNGFYVFRKNALYLERPTLLKGYQCELVTEDVNDIIWCEQSFSSDSEAADTYQTTLYFRKNKRKTHPMFSDSEYGCFQFALELKKRAPHLLYGYSEAYKKLHKRNPEELMAIAESKMREKR